MSGEPDYQVERMSWEELRVAYTAAVRAWVIYGYTTWMERLADEILIRGNAE